MKATTDQIKEAKATAASQVTKILADFAKHYELQDMTVDVTVIKHSEEGSNQVAVTISTEINVKI